MHRADCRYHPYYCEENARLLVADPRLSPLRRWVVFVTNANRTCMMHHQRAHPGGEPVIWDYHVVVVVRAQDGLQVLDLDTTLRFPSALDAYLSEAFPAACEWPRTYQPRFRVVPSQDFVQRFASDRRHMRDERGQWQAPPPPWPIIQGSGAPHDLDRWLALDDDEPGRGTVHDLSSVTRAFQA